MRLTTASGTGDERGEPPCKIGGMASRDYVHDLREQLDFLSSSMRAFDSGIEHEAKRIGVVLRTLLSSTGGTPLLRALELREEVEWLSLAQPIDPLDLMWHNALAVEDTSNTPAGATCAYRPRGNESRFRRWVPFGEWWETQTVIHAPASNIRFSRMNVVAMAANRDGGAHVAPLRPTERLVASNAATPWGVGNDRDGWVMHDGSPIPATLRAIATEVMQTIGQNAATLGIADGFVATPLPGGRTPKPPGVEIP